MRNLGEPLRKGEWVSFLKGKQLKDDSSRSLLHVTVAVRHDSSPLRKERALTRTKIVMTTAPRQHR